MEIPILEQIETNDMSVRGGRSRNRASAGLPRNESTSPSSVAQEIAAARTFGEGPRNQRASNVILPEAGELPGDAMVAIRIWCRNLSREFSNVIDRAAREEFLSEQWWEAIDEAETISNTRETLLGYLRGA